MYGLGSVHADNSVTVTSEYKLTVFAHHNHILIFLIKYLPYSNSHARFRLYTIPPWLPDNNISPFADFSLEKYLNRVL